jgi:hypothetical protein
MSEIKNAIIESATLSTSDHGLLTAWLTLNYGGSSQGFGGYSLYLPKSFAHHNIMSPAGHFIFRVMEIAGVEKWENLKGKTVRVDCKHSGVLGLGHIVKDDWFYPEKDFENAKNKEANE